MSFDERTRSALERVVTACRKRLREDVADQLRGPFGMHPDGTILSLSQMSHLSDEQRVEARGLRELFDHFTATAQGKDEAERRKSAYERVELEISFTILNRLVALRMCEERKLVVECVRQGMASDGFRLFENLSGGALGTRYQTYKVFLESLFDELAVDLGILFDRSTPLSSIFPSERCLEDVFAYLNNPDLAHIWTKDETIGWVYQYFNPPEERRAMRENRAPRDSRELAVRNQFFTPRYVVEFLTDNTLGRTWYEMCKGETRLVDKCHFLARHPNEVFLDEGIEPEGADQSEGDASKEELLRKPYPIPYRKKKDPRDLKVLDPACGSGHFLLYAYDLFETIYEEAFENADAPCSGVAGKSLREEYESLDALRRDIPVLILRYNLYGVDIDARACQIAALALWLRAQRAYKDAGLKAAERPQINKTNIVTAEPMPGEAEMRHEFTASLDSKVIGELVEDVFEQMKLAGETGSLLKIEEDIREAVAEKKAAYEKEIQRRKETAGFLPEMAPQYEDTLLDLIEPTDEGFWERAEDEIFSELERYALRAQNGFAFQRRLFAEDAAQGFAFVDLCRKKYDVVLMNPPFGDASEPSQDYIDETYGDTKGDVYKAFVECFQDRLVERGYLGIISSRTGFFLSQSRDWRERIVLRLYRPLLLADLGYGVLDAMVETAAYVLRSISGEERRNLILEILPDLLTVPTDRKGAFSIPKYQKHRGGLKRHQAVQELKQLEEGGYIKPIAGRFARFMPYQGFIQRAENARPVTYPPLICFRLIRKMDKEGALLDLIQKFDSPKCYITRPEGFASIPNTPFSYWAGDRLRSLFAKLPPIESNDRTVRVGIQTSDDFRFLRAWWEVDAASLCPPTDHPIEPQGSYCILRPYQWFPFAKGGTYSPFYSDLHLVVNWRRDGSEMKIWAGSLYNQSHWSRILKNVEFNFRPGLTWPRRTNGLSFRILPAGSMFADKGPAAFVATNDYKQLLALVALMNSRSFYFFVQMLVARVTLAQSFEVGLIRSIPMSDLSEADSARLAELAGVSLNVKHELDRANELSHVFNLPALLEAEGESIAQRAENWRKKVQQAEQQLTEAQHSIDEITLRLYGIDETERMALEEAIGEEVPESAENAGEDDEVDEEAGNSIAVEVDSLVADLLSYAFGCAMGRWDARFATGETQQPELADPFAPLPIHSPGMLTEFTDKQRGILVDDAGLDELHPHRDDVARRVQEVFDLLWKEQAEAINQDVCEILGFRNLREYIQRPSGFFQEHLNRYTKSRRRAPIYWPLSTSSGSYTVWLYYSRLNDQTLYTVVNNYIEPKIVEVERAMARAQGEVERATGRRTSQLRDQISNLRAFLNELRDFRQELLRVAELPYKPNLNDGVLINAAPLHRLFRHRQWSRDTQDCWSKLSQGKYEWSHMAFTLWPDRVQAASRRDASIAIAHGLENFTEEHVEAAG